MAIFREAKTHVEGELRMRTDTIDFTIPEELRTKIDNFLDNVSTKYMLSKLKASNIVLVADLSKYSLELSLSLNHETPEKDKTVTPVFIMR